MRRILQFSAVATLAALVGCASVQAFLDKNNTAAMLVVQQATARTIEVGKSPEEKAARAQKVIQIATEVQQVVDGTAKDLPSIIAAVGVRVAALKLGPADALLAADLVQVAGQLIQQKLCPAGVTPSDPQAPTGCTIPANLTTYVDNVLGWVISSARLYTV